MPWLRHPERLHPRPSAVPATSPYPVWTEAMTQLAAAGVWCDYAPPRPSRFGGAPQPQCWQLHAYYYALTHRVPPLWPSEEQQRVVHRECHADQPHTPGYWTTQAPPLVILLRGAPGSGKSTWAAQYQAHWPGETVVISATDYFRDVDGLVQWRQEEAKLSHAWCTTVLYWLCAWCTPRIVVDNTHLRHWELEANRMTPIVHAYRVFQHVCAGAWPNTSGVPEAQVVAMRKRFEASSLIPTYADAAD